jgi:hypothetical protein
VILSPRHPALLFGKTLDTSTLRIPVLVRRLLIFVTPLAMTVVSILHPHAASASIVAALQPQLGLWLSIHVLQLVLLGLLGATL